MNEKLDLFARLGRLLCVMLVFVGVILFVAGMSQVLASPGQAERSEASDLMVLARVDILGPMDALSLPAYARLQDATGREYVLVIAPLTELKQSGLDYLVLDVNARISDYIVALERRPSASQQFAYYVDVLHNDGRQIVARAAASQVETMAALGFEVRRLPRSPLVLLAQAAPATESFAYDPLVAGMIAQVQQSTVYTYDGRLSGEWPAIVGGQPYVITTRHTNSGTPVQKATQYVYEHMQALGLAVSYHNWTVGSYSNRNVIGVLTGSVYPDEIVLITAHLDDMPPSGLAPGADDNASGSVAVLVAADILSQYQFERTIRFVFFTGEEQGLYGSGEYADLIYAAGDNVVAVYNMDMIAWDSIGGPTLRLHTRTTGNPGYPGDLAIAGVFTNVVSAYGLSGSLTPIIDADGEWASDHSSFWDKGYSAILAIEDDVSDFNSYYHTSNDKLQYMNMSYFTNYVRASVGTAAHLTHPLGDLGALTGVVSDGATAQPIVGVEVEAIASPTQMGSAISGANGVYSMTLRVGTYTVTASTPGYMPFLALGVQVVKDQVTTLPVTLQVTPTFVITGYVRDAVTFEPLSATVRLPGHSLSSQTESTTGFYSLIVTLPPGKYTLQAESMHHLTQNHLITATGTDLHQDFDLEPICLLVVDDDEGMSYGTYYSEALSRLGMSYRQVETAPDLATLSRYHGVIWLTGNDSDSTLEPEDRANLSAYLDGGGRLFLSGQDIGMDIGGTSFYHDHLHAAFHTDDTNVFTLTGLDYLSGLDINIQGSGGANNQSFPSGITPVNGAIAVYEYPHPYLYGGVAYSGTYRVVYFSFGYEAINTQSMRDAVMSATLDYLDVCGTPQEPEASFATSSPVSWGETMLFTNTTRGTAWMTYTWDFGDRSPETHVANPTHLYTQPGLYNVALTATSRYGSNGYSQVVTVTAQPPDIVTSPAVLTATLQVGSVSSHLLKVSNIGKSDLVWNLAEVPSVDWLAESLVSGTVPMSASLDSQVTFDASRLLGGYYTTTLQIASNDPDENLIYVPVTLTVWHAAVITPTMPTSTILLPTSALIVDFDEPVVTSTIGFVITPEINFTVTWTTHGLQTTGAQAWQNRAILEHEPFRTGVEYILSVLPGGQTVAGGTVEPMNFAFAVPGLKVFLPVVLKNS